MDGFCQKSDTSDPQVFEDGTCRLILIGKTGSGKSATANTIIGRNCFKEGTGINSETKIGGFNYVKRDNLTIEVMDTPGLADTHDDDAMLVEEIKKSVYAMYPGPHALLLVLRGHTRFTKDEFQVYQTLKEIFGAQFPSYMIVVFTSVNAKEEHPKIMEDEIRHSAHLSTILTEANWRYVLFDNKADENEKQLQVDILLKKVQSLALTNQPSYYRHFFSDHLRSSFDKMVKDEIKLLRRKMLTENSDAPSDLSGMVPDTSDAQVFEDGTCRLVLIGKTGSGKSATANTIIGRNCFKEGTGINSETKIGGFNYVNKDNLTIEVMDTPGLADSDNHDAMLVEEIKKSVFAIHPGPHALLLVLKGNARFTNEEFQVYQALKEIFGAQFPSYMIVVFTSVNVKEEYAKIIEDEIRRCEKLNMVLNEANWRYVLFDNKADESEKRVQVDELLEKVKSLVLTNRLSYFRHNFSDHLRASFDEMVKDEIKQLISSSDASKAATQEFCDSTDKSKATQNLGECQKTPDGGSVTVQVIQTHEANESNEQSRVKKLAQHFNQLVSNPLPKRIYGGARTGKIDSNEGNTNALESEPDKKKCENLSNGNKPTEQASVEVDNELHRQSKIDIKLKIVNQPEKMTKTQRHEYKKSLSELPDKVKEGFEKKNLKDLEQCTVM